jgi:hypothetical protein
MLTVVKTRNRLSTVDRDTALISRDMDAFPEFVKHPANRIACSNQATPGEYNLT